MLLGDILRHHALLRPDSPALLWDDRTWSFRDLRDDSYRLAHALIDAGVAHQEHVAVLAKNDPGYMTAYFGCAAAGAIITCVNYRLADPEFVYIITNSEARLLLLDAEFVPVWERIREQCPNIERVVVFGDAPEGYPSYDEFLRDQPAHAPDRPVSENDVALQMYTSGTTGVPKGAMLSHRNLVNNAMSSVLGMDLDGAHCFLICAPLYHMAAGICSINSLLAGAPVLLHREFNPQQVLDDMEGRGVSHTLLIPAMILFLLQMPDLEKRDFSRLEQIAYGASPIPYEVLKKAMDAFGCGFLQAYGQTEATAILTVLTPEDHRAEGERGERLLKSAGREILGAEVRVVGEDGRPVKTGEWGEVIARSPGVMKGYWNMPDKTAEAIREGWLWTGDIGYLDDEGYLYIVDRSKDMIISGGENIYPREIEEVLFGHEAVADAAVIGVPNDKGWGEEVKACVVRKPDTELDEAAVIAFCRERLAGYKCPKSVDFIEEIPRNLSGKVLKKDLRAPYWEGHTRAVN